MAKPETIDQYIDEFPETVQSILRQVRQVIRESAPSATETISYGIPTFKLGNKNLIHFAGYEKHIGLYATPATHAIFTAELSRYRSGRGSVQFPLSEPMPLGLIRRMVRFRVEQVTKIEEVMMATLQKITPNLWFDGIAKEAVDFYTSVFPDSRIIDTSHYPVDGLADFQQPLAGKELTIDFELASQRFTAINAGPEFKFNEAVSFLVSCKDQEEIDYYWEKLSAVPESEQCGWLKDKYGLSWQIVPANMAELMKSPKAFQVLMQMKKIEIAALR